MSKVANAVRRTTTGDITTANAYLRSVVLTPGSDAATVTVRAGGSGGAILLVLSATSSTAGNTVPSGDLHGAYCGAGIHVTLTGTGPSVTVVYE